MKKLLPLLFAALLAASLFLVSCGETENDPPHTECVDENADGTCDVCGKDMPKPEPVMLDVIVDSEPVYQIVVASTASSSVKQKVLGFINDLKEEDVSFVRVDDYRKDKIKDYEILVGASVAGREDYAIDVHTLGNNGYTIKVDGTKIIVAGGSDSSLEDAVDAFFEDYVLKKLTKKGDLTIASDYEDYHPQTDYPVTSITVGGVDLSEFTAVAVQTDTLAYSLAQKTREAFYERSGIWIPIAETDKGHSVIVRTVNDAGNDGFRIKTENDDLVIECAYKNAFAEAVNAFLTTRVKSAEGDLKFNTGYLYTKNVAVVTYEQFGAKGNGMTDDLDAIIAAHEYANAGGQTVRANDDATYYIAQTGKTAIIKTNVDWGKAHFVIDDRNLTYANRGKPIFTVSPDYEATQITVPENYKLARNATNVGMTFDYDMLITVSYSGNLVYKRYGDFAGASQADGIAQSDLLLVDRDGNIDPSTPLLWDYSAGVTSITGFRVDESPLTIKGGIFTTKANTMAHDDHYGYAERNLHVERSNVTLDGITHYVTGEPDDPIHSKQGCPYMGFFSFKGANHALMQNCHITGRARIDGGSNYELCINQSNDVKIYRCDQTDDICDMNKWGCMASNGSKNIVYDSCSLSRFDDHRGLVNGKILHCEIGHLINLIGGGDFLVEDTTLYLSDNGAILTLRSDYGASWDGNITVRDCTVISERRTIYLFKSWWQDYDPGYVCHFGKNITVENLTVPATSTLYFVTNMLSGYNGPEITDLSKHPNHPYVMPEKITVTGLSGVDSIYLAPSTPVQDLFGKTEYDKTVIIK